MVGFKSCLKPLIAEILKTFYVKCNTDYYSQLRLQKKGGANELPTPFDNRIIVFMVSSFTQEISSFLVTNAQFPEAIRDMDPCTQLYVSIGN